MKHLWIHADDSPPTVCATADEAGRCEFGETTKYVPANAHDALVAALRETREAAAACFRVIADQDSKHIDGILDQVEVELAKAGVKDGFGVRADAALALAEKV